MADYTFTVDGTDVCAEYGAHLLDFAEELPQPKVIKVSIPAGIDLDITDAFGAIGYTNGTHTLSLLVVGEDETERVERVRQLVAYLHGKMMDYGLSWDAGYSYRGRFLVAVERVVDYASRVTVTIDRKPWKSKREIVSLDAHPTADFVIDGSVSYQDIKVKLLVPASVSVDGGTSQSLSAGTHTVASSLQGSDHEVSVTLSDWLMYLDEETNNIVVNTSSHTVTVADGDVTVSDAPYTIANGNLVFTDTAKQEVKLSYYRLDL